MKWYTILQDFFLLDSVRYCCFLLKQVIGSHQFKPTDVFTGNHIYNTNATKKCRVTLIIGDMYCYTLDNGNYKANKYALNIKNVVT